MSSLGGSCSLGNRCRSRCDDLHGLVDRQRGLRQPDHLVLVADRHVVHRIDPVDQLHVLGRLPGGTDDLLVALVADQQDVVVVTGEPPGLVVHLGNQRAGGVDGVQVPLGGLDVHRRRDAVRREHHDGPLGNLVGLLDEHRAGLLQGVDHMPVVHDLVAHVNRGTVLFQRAFHRFDGPVHTRAVATRLRQEHPLTDRIGGYRAGLRRESPCR